MNHSYQTDRPGRRVILISVISVLGFGMTIASPVLLSGCGDDKSQMTRVETTDNPADKAKESMKYYQSILKGGTAKGGATNQRK